VTAGTPSASELTVVVTAREGARVGLLCGVARSAGSGEGFGVRAGGGLGVGDGARRSAVGLPVGVARSDSCGVGAAVDAGSGKVGLGVGAGVLAVDVAMEGTLSDRGV